MAEKDQMITPFGRRTSTEWSGGAPLVEPESWMQDALCAETDPEVFFPEKGGSTLDAKNVCGGCDVAAECLDYALRKNEKYGVWGGFAPYERRQMRERAA